MIPRRSEYGSLRGEDYPTPGSPLTHVEHGRGDGMASLPSSPTYASTKISTSTSRGGWPRLWVAALFFTAFSASLCASRFASGRYHMAPDISGTRGGGGAVGDLRSQLGTTVLHGDKSVAALRQHGNSSPGEVAGVDAAAAPATTGQSAPTEAWATSTGGLSFVALNEYTRRGDVVGQGYPWLEGRVLVEPYRETSLEVVSPQKGMLYSWKVEENDLEDDETRVIGEFEGETVNVVFLKAPTYTVTLFETNSSDGMQAEEVRRTEVEVVCRYVRREIRSLFDDERNDMFDAMKVLWDVKTVEGQGIYGDTYLDVWSIDMFHQVGASDINCDHLHDGLGFGITHSMVTMMFENSLQLVNPKISLPYWDFTIEAYKVDTDHDGDYSKLRDVSDLWTEDWFGSVDPSDWQVKDGRWAYTEIPIIEKESRDMMGADVYGRMRSPWNVNDQPNLSRGLGEMCGVSSTDFYKWPTCESHYNLQDEFTSYYGYTWYSQYQPHGPVHVWIGGSLNCKKDMDKTVAIVGEEYRISITGFSFIMRKDLFRKRMFKCHATADPSVSAIDVMLSGQCGCTDLNLEEGDDYIGIYDLFAKNYDFPEFTESEKRQLAIQYCSGAVGIGESSQSSSPLDPTFWSLHPTMERLLIFKFLSGTFTDYSWPDEPGSWTGMDGETYDVVLSLQQDECYGHRGSDVFPYQILNNLITPVFTFGGKTGPNTLSNRELIKLFDPQMNTLSYIYDNFDWPHCAAQGYDFKDFYNPNNGKSGFKGRAATPEGRKRKSRTHGFGIFKKGEAKAPLYNAPTSVKKKT